MGLYVIGSNMMGQLGLGSDHDSTNKPIEHPFFKNKKIIKIATGKLHTLVLCENNELYSWGVNDDCALGREGDESVPELVNLKQNIVDICCGASYSAVLTDKGNVFGCGTFKSSSGVFGFDKDNKFQSEFKKIENIRRIEGIYGGENHIIMIDRNNNLWTFGANESGQLGRASRERHIKRSLEPSQISTKQSKTINNAFVYAAAGGSHSMAINTDRECFGWGSNFNGQLGVGDLNASLLRRKVDLENVIWVACGSTHTLFLNAKKELYGCGDNTLSQLGIEGQKMADKPVFIIDKIDYMEAGCDFCIARRGNKLLVWGSNLNGELGFDEVEFDEIKRPTELNFNFGKIVNFSCGTDFVIVQTK